MEHDLFTYPTDPGWKKTDTSRDAAKDMAGKAGKLRAAVLDTLWRHGPLTTEEIAVWAGHGYASIQPRTSELRLAGRIEDSGERRLNNSGKRAIVWRLVKEATSA